MTDQWPSSGRIVHVDVHNAGGTRIWHCLPSLVLETPDESDQPAETLRLEVHPTAEFPHPLTVPGPWHGDHQLTWHWPEHVGPPR